MMTTPLTDEFLATVTRAVGVLLVAGLLLPLGRVTPGRFLRYWPVAWASLAVSLLSAYAAVRFPDHQGWALVGYAGFEFVFAALVWAGCLDVATGQPPRPLQIVILLGVAGAVVSGPAVLADARAALSLHAGLLAVLFLLALLATRRCEVTAHTPTVGLWVLRGSLAGLLALTAVETAYGGRSSFLHPDRAAMTPFNTLPVVLLEVMLAFGMVLLATDRMREQLEAANRQLQTAADELGRVARLDGLTGLLNRLGFETLLAGEDAPDSGCVAVIDLNNLKPLNDRHGHAVGDAALKVVARGLRTHFRVTDPLFRTGGDEFAVVMVGCGEDDLADRLRRLDESLLGQRLPGLPEAIDIVAAWGAAEFDSPAGLRAAYQRADAAMYERKRQLKARQPQAVLAGRR